MKKRSNAKEWVLIVVLLLILIFLILFVFLHEIPGKQIRSFVAEWKSGNIDSLMSGQRYAGTSLLKEEKQFRKDLLEEYGDMMPGQEEEPEEETEEDGELFLENVLPYTGIRLKTPFLIYYPCKVTVTITGPDMEALLQTLDYESYADSEILLADIKTALANRAYSERQSTFEIEIGKEGKELYLTTAYPEIVEALYGGTLSLYAKEEVRLYEEIFGE